MEECAMEVLPSILAPAFQPRSSRHRRILETRAELHTRFPKCFMPFGAPKLPLKIGIDKDLLAVADGALHYQRMLWALIDYVNGDHYLAKLIAGAVRVDLDGNPAGTVSEIHGQRAAAGLAKRKRRQDAAQREKVRTTIKVTAPVVAAPVVAAPKPPTRRKFEVEVVRRRPEIKGGSRTFAA
jgi:ProP effector